MEAAFFDLDKTVIARPSMVAFGGHLRREGLLSRRLLLRALWAQLIFLTLGADERRLARMRDAALRVSAGWEQRRITAIVEETLTEVVEPIVFEEALGLLRQHQDAGRKVFIVSASPEEVVAPLARYLGADEAVATRARLDDEGRYTGEVELYCYGPEKRRVIEEIAARDGIDLEASYAYSDSATDLPMLEAVGRPVAVNPDRELARVASARQWEVLVFTHGVPLRERVVMPSAQSLGIGTGVLASVAGAGVAAWWWWRRSRAAPPAPAPWHRRWRAGGVVARGWWPPRGVAPPAGPGRQPGAVRSPGPSWLPRRPGR